ncbi:Cytochrome b-c1 complex subunit 1, mitochondrial [Aphelenchoides bicaudatus]|nr:Cytochrome b-c1 complex subunit 1, mitochondrial [Aphelenchoides bicaudatus]
MLRTALKRGISTIRQSSSFPRQAQEFLQQSDTVFSELPNALRIASVTNGHPTSTIGVYIDSGSRYEHEGNNGVASLLEHLIYKGTAKRSAKQLEQELGKYGARLNSFTSRDQTVYLLQVVNENVEKAVEILADVLRNSKLSAEDIEVEKQLLLQQLAEVEENQEEVVWDMLHAAAFQGTPLALSPYGKTEAIKSLTRDDVANFLDDHYKGSRVVIASAGGVDHSQVNSFASKYFGDLGNEYKQKIPLPRGTRFTGSEFVYRDDSMPYLWGAVAVEGVGAAHPDALALKLASQYVGQWDQSHGSGYNSPIATVQKINGLPGIISYEGFSVNYTDTGLFGARFVTDGKDMEQAMDVVGVVQRQWKHMSTSVTDEELDRTKNQFRTGLFAQLSDNTGLAHWLATETLAKGEPTSLSNLEKRIRNLDAGAIREAMSRHVYDRDLAAAGIGRTEAMPAYLIMRYKQSWWRL